MESSKLVLLVGTSSCNKVYNLGLLYFLVGSIQWMNVNANSHSTPALFAFWP